MIKTISEKFKDRLADLRFRLRPVTHGVNLRITDIQLTKLVLSRRVSRLDATGMDWMAGRECPIEFMKIKPEVSEFIRTNKVTVLPAHGVLAGTQNPNQNLVSMETRLGFLQLDHMDMFFRNQEQAVEFKLRFL